MSSSRTDGTPRHAWQNPWVVLAVVLVGCAALMGLAVLLDRHEDRTRPMYADAFRMAELQTRELNEGHEMVPADVTHDAEVKVGRTSFRPSAGVRVLVVARDDGYCVRAWNQHGDRTRWLCGDADSTP